MNARIYPFPSRPIRVDGGIKARSRRGAIGEQWWSQRFIAVLESWGMSGRLSRGRGYARSGQVLEFELKRGEVVAWVQGSRPQPYHVRIGVVPLTAAQWRAVESRLASRAVFRAKLLAGEMPHEIEQVFDECGTPLFPSVPADLDMSCTCPDYEVPCKHLAAVCYVLAEAFDNDPFGMLAWRGRGRDKLLAALRQHKAEASGPAPAEPLLDVPGRPLEECLDDFWSPGMSPARLNTLPAAPATPPDLLLRMFEPPAVRIRGTDLRTVLASAYERMAAPDPADDPPSADDPPPAADPARRPADPPSPDDPARRPADPPSAATPARRPADPPSAATPARRPAGRPR